MADLTLSEFHEIRRRQSVQDFKHILELLERDEEIVLVDDPSPEEDEIELDIEGLDLEAEAELSSVVDGAPTPGEGGDAGEADAPASLHPSEAEGADLTVEPAPLGSVVDPAPAQEDGENADH